MFDRYIEGSIKTHEHNRRSGGVVYPSLVLTMDTFLPSVRDTVMKSVCNRKELIRVFTTSNSSDSVDMIGEENSIFKHKEADCKIISYVQFIIHNQKQSIQVITDDSDIFLLLVYFYWKWRIRVQITMKKFCGHVIDINATDDKLGHNCSQLLIVHAVSGCDTVGYMCGKGKVSAVTIIQKHDLKLDAFGDLRADLVDVLKAGHTHRRNSIITVILVVI